MAAVAVAVIPAAAAPVPPAAAAFPGGAADSALAAAAAEEAKGPNAPATTRAQAAAVAAESPLSCASYSGHASAPTLSSIVVTGKISLGDWSP